MRGIDLDGRVNDMERRPRLKADPGDVFGMLTVSGGEGRYRECACMCGASCRVRVWRLAHGMTVACPRCMQERRLKLRGHTTSGDMRARIHVVATDAELAEIRDAAQRHGESARTWLRGLALREARKGKDAG